MINIDLSEEEFNLIINYRKGKYNIDITEDEYNEIVSRRNKSMKTYEKYIENIKILLNESNVIVSNSASMFLDVAVKLQKNIIDLKAYRQVKDIEYNGNDQNIIFKINS